MPHLDHKSKLALGRHDRIMALVQALPVLPTAIHVPARIMQLYRSPNSPPLEKFAEVLVADASLSAKVLELANSAWFAPTRTVTKVSDALRMIGLSNLLPLLFGLSLAGLFNKADLPPEERNSLWQTSLLKAILARQWARWRGIDLQEEAFLLGVLQDIAIPAMFAGDRSTSPEFMGVLDLPETVRSSREAALYTVDHAELGRALCKRLQLPELFVNAVATHHAPEGPTLPESHRALAGGLQFAAAVPHGMTRLDEHAARRLAEAFLRVAPNTTPQEFVEFVKGATEASKSIMGMLAPPDNAKLGMKTFLQDVSDQIARTMLSAIGTSNQTIEQLQASRLNLEKKIKELCAQVARADYDALTGTLNRGGLLNRGDKMIGLARTFEMGCAVGFLDVDNFKSINDRYGHAIGDRALTTVAAALLHMMQNRGMVARCGGDEFVFVMIMPSDCSREAIAQEVEQAVGSLKLDVGKNETINLKSSVGISWLAQPDEQVNIHEAMKLADHQMYAMKHASAVAAA